MDARANRLHGSQATAARGETIADSDYSHCSPPPSVHVIAKATMISNTCAKARAHPLSLPHHRVGALVRTTIYHQGSRPPSQPTLHHGNSASHLASSNTDTRTPAVRPRVTLIVPCCYALPHVYHAQHRSTSNDRLQFPPPQPTLTPSVHASCNR